MSPSSPGLRRRAKERRTAAELAILDATEALLSTREFRDLTVEDVMATTGLSRTTFYRYFPDLESVLLRRLTELGGDLRRAADSWLQDPFTGLEAGVEFVALFKEHGRLFLAFEQAAGAGTEIGVAWRAVIQEFTDGYSEFIEDLCEQELSNIQRPRETARALVAMTERYLIDTYGRGPAVDVVVAASTLADIWQRALFSAGVAKPPIPGARQRTRPAQP